MSRGFDRVMIHLEVAHHLKLRELTDGEFKAFLVGVLPIAAKADIRGALMVGARAATEADVAHQARVSPRTAAACLRKLREVGMLEHDATIGADWLHDFDEWNPPPKHDRTAADRQRRKRARDAATVTASSRRDVTVCHAPVTGLSRGEVEVEVEELPPHPLPGEQEEERPLVAKIADAQRRQTAETQQVFDAWASARERQLGIRSTMRLDDKRRRVIRAALKSHGLADVLDAVVGWRHSPHHTGQNATRTVHDGLGLLLRDAEHIEKFRDLERANRGSVNAAVPAGVYSPPGNWTGAA